jgi:hypothetical protein
MKKLILITLTLIAGKLSAQWKTESIDNGFDPVYHLAFCHDGNYFLKLENFGDGKVAMILYDGYFCTEEPYVELAYKMGEEWSRFNGNAIMRTTDQKKIIISVDIDKNMYDEFRKSSLLKIRVDDDHCGKKVYQFDMTGSTTAINWVRRSPN